MGFDIEIIDYEDIYHEDYKELAYEWLVKFELLEPEDEKIINNPRQVVLDRGGFIFMARHKDRIVGTASLVKMGNEAFELAKFAVTEGYQGKGIAVKLLDKCLDKAREEKAKRIMLYTNSRLTSARSLYLKYNFKDILSDNDKYETADSKMELAL